MDLIETILREEREYQRMFAPCIEKDYGLLFHNQNNRDSNDSNHAIFYPDKPMDMDAVLDEVTAFYLEKGITPRVYSPFVDDYFDRHRTVFASHGYTFENCADDETISFMTLTEEHTIRRQNRLDIVRLVDWDNRLADDIFIPNDEPYEIDVIKGNLRHSNFYLFAGFLDGVAVTMTNLHVSRIGCTRFDFIETAKDHRRQGYAREILSFVVDFCRDNDFPVCYQWPAHDTSARICYEAGFRELFRRKVTCAVYSG